MDKKRPDIDRVIREIEEQKEDRTKYIFFFQISMTTDEKNEFRRGLKKLLNKTSGIKKEDDEEENIVVHREGTEVDMQE